MTSSHPSSPLDIPELRTHIVRFLDHADQKACALVSWAWYADLLPFLWERRAFLLRNLLKLTADDQSVALCSLRNYGFYIKHLRLPRLLTLGPRAESKNIVETLLQQCRSLISIYVGVTIGDSWRTVKSLFAHNIGLQQIDLRFVHSFEEAHDEASVHNADLPQAMATLPQLRRLKLDCVIHLRDVILILEACKNLEALELGLFRDTLYSQQNAIAPDATTTDGEHEIISPADVVGIRTTMSTFKLKRLVIIAKCNDPVLGILLARCSSLEFLRLGSLGENAVRALRDCRRLFPQLACVQFVGNWMSPSLRIAFVNAFLDHHLREFRVYHAWTDLIHNLVKNQHQTLESLSCFYTSRAGNMHALVRILERCHKLKRLTFHVLHQKFVNIRWILRIQQWACDSSLEELDVPFELDSLEKDPWWDNRTFAEMNEIAPGRDELEQAEVVFMKRLGTLSKLKHLRLYSGFEREKRRKYMLWSLSTGLEHLAGLVQLQTLDIVDEVLPFGIPELQFLKENWRNLKVLKCGSIRSPEIRRWLDREWPKLTVETSQEYTY